MRDNNSKTIVFYCFNFSMGGTETLILRLLEFYGNKNYRTILLTETPIHESIIEDSRKVCFEHYIYNKDNKEFLSGSNTLKFTRSERPLIITQFLPEFLKCFTLLRKSKYGVNFKHTLYIVHPNSTLYGPRRLTFLAKVMILVLLKKKALVFMDETCAETCLKIYNLKKTLVFDIYRLPIFINKNLNLVKKNDIFNILTITRFEFPFKGYVLGLINSFSQLHQKSPSTLLTIIGHGKGVTEIQTLISKLPYSVSSKISVLDEVPYHEINDYIEKCDVYVGMGTTVLDAANNNKVVITAVAYQKSNLAVGYFHEKYKTIGEVFQENKEYLIFDALLEKVLNASEYDFDYMRKKSKEALKEHYNIEVVGEKLENHTIDYFSLAEKFLIDTMAYIHLYSVRIVEKVNN